MPNSHLELAKVINNFPSINDKEWGKLSQNSRERYNKHFSVNIFKKKLSNLVENVIDGNLGNI